MNVSKSFLRDFAYLANRYGWTPADIEEIKIETWGQGAPMSAYWTALAAAHRAGYEQTADNGYLRLHEWQERRADGLSPSKGPKFSRGLASPLSAPN
jgi:hypothetical protein